MLSNTTARIDVQTAPSEGERQQLMSDHFPLVDATVRRLRNRLPRHADFEELHSVGVSGLVAAARQYEPGRHADFRQYAGARIRGAMLDELRRLDCTPRTARAKQRKLEEATMELEQIHGRAPTERELSHHMGMNATEFRRYQRNAADLRRISIEAPSQTRDGQTGQSLCDLLADESSEHASDRMEREELSETVADRISELPERERQILSLYYFEGMRLAEIAEIFGVTEARICQIHTRVLKTLRAAVVRQLG